MDEEIVQLTNGRTNGLTDEIKDRPKDTRTKVWTDE